MKIIYACSFNINGFSGKSRATRQKLLALKSSVESLHIVAPSSNNKLLNLLSLPIIELILITKLALLRPEFFISRGYVGLVASFFCNIFGIRVVREVHADCIGEVSLLSLGSLKLKFATGMAILQNYIDLQADIRVFNHPILMNWWHDKNGYRKNDIYVYNGFDKNSKSLMSKEAARSKFKFDSKTKYIVFVGSVSAWHGVNILEELQNEFERNSDDYKVVVGGGCLKSSSNIINISPLDDIGCAELIRASDACLLTVTDNRVSPGSPLKLYDYIVNGGFVITQSDVLGYSDEVQISKCGITVDFQNISEVRNIIVASTLEVPEVCSDDMSWDSRMKMWLHHFEKIKI